MKIAGLRGVGTRVDEPLAVEDYAGTTAPGSGSVRSFFANRLGSIAVAVSVATGAVAAEAEYDSFGAREITVGTEAEMPRYGFTGREHDAETGLIYSRARHYDPAIGQFLQRDPIGFAAGDLNLYAYVQNDPYNFTDPSGLAASAGTAGGEARDWAMGTGISGAVRAGLNSFIEKLLVVFSKVPKIRPLLNAADAAGAGGTGGDPGDDGDDEEEECGDNLENTPTTNASDFTNIRGTPAKLNRLTGEIWVFDMLHKNHYEVYRNRRQFDRGRRDRSVWDDGRAKDCF